MGSSDERVHGGYIKFNWLEVENWKWEENAMLIMVAFDENS